MNIPYHGKELDEGAPEFGGEVSIGALDHIPQVAYLRQEYDDANNLWKDEGVRVRIWRSHGQAQPRWGELTNRIEVCIPPRNLVHILIHSEE